MTEELIERSAVLEIIRRENVGNNSISGEHTNLNRIIAQIGRLSSRPPQDTFLQGIEAERLFLAIQHGDDDHRAWLKEAITAHFDGRPVPPPRGDGRKAARIKELETELEAIRALSSNRGDTHE